MKKFISILCFFLVFTFGITVFSDAARDTYVNRHYFQNGSFEVRELIIRDNITWKKSQSPYVVEDRVVIKSGGSLTIEEGVEVLFRDYEGNSELEFVVENKGKLFIKGSSGSEVLFSKFSKAEDNWESINFEKGSFGDISFGEFKFGGNSSESIINIASDDVKIVNTRFTDSFSSGISIIGPVDPIIKSTEFDLDNEYVIIQKDVNGDPTLNNLFSHKGTGKIKIEAGTSFDDISRNINWENPSMPYVIDGWLNIGPKGSLNIKPSVKVLFSSSDTNLKGNITVHNEGKLVAKNVEFDSENLVGKDHNWDYIYGEEGAILRIENCFINNGGYSSKGTLRIDTNDANIKNTTISNSSSHGLYISKSDISPLFKDLIINGSKGYGIYLKENAKPKFSGIEQKNNWRNGVFVESLDLYGENIWNFDEGPYYLNGIYNLNAGAVLNIEPGNTVYFDESDNLKKSSIVVEANAKIISKGKTGSPIIFTSSNTNKKPGDWGSIVLRNGSMARFNYTIFEYGGANDYIVLGSDNSNYGVLYALTDDLVINNSIFRNLENHGIYIGDGVAPYSIEGNKFDISSNNYAIYKWDKNTNVNGNYNWWNHITGPYNLVDNPSGSGAMVSNGVYMANYLKSPNESPNIGKSLWTRQVTSDKNKIWRIKFNSLISSKYVNTSYINVLNSNDEYVDIDISLSSDTILVKPKNSYSKGRYKLIIKEGINDLYGNPLKQRIEMYFDVE